MTFGDSCDVRRGKIHSLSPKSAPFVGIPAENVPAHAAGVYDDADFGSALYGQPALSMIAEERSPRSQPEAAPSPRGGAASPIGGIPGHVTYDADGNVVPPPPPRPPRIHVGLSSPLGPHGLQSPLGAASPMSAHKPPLTPGRLAGSSRGSGGSAGTFRQSPSPVQQRPGQPLSPTSTPDDGSLDADQSLRGAHIGSDEMCLSADDEDEEYNRLANAQAAAPAPAAVPRIQPMAHESQEDIMAWTPTAEKAGGAGAAFPFPLEGFDPPPSGGGNEGQNKTAGMDMFDNFADFDDMVFDSSDNQFSSGFQQENVNSSNKDGGDAFSSNDQFQTGTSGKKKACIVEFPDFLPSPAATAPASSSRDNARSGSRSVAHASPVSLVLEDSRARRSARGGMSATVVPPPNDVPFRSPSARSSGGSVNSAPALAASLAARSGNGGRGGLGRVIDNLELHVNKRGGPGGQGAAAAPSPQPQSAHQGGNASAASSSEAAAALIREAKERIRRENLMNNEGRVIDMLASGQATPKDAWLFDEVTNALGPRSTAADLESLGGRSNKSGRSRSSLGGKSHRSHRSHRSKKGGGNGRSSHRRHRKHSGHNDDGVSVDSRQSRNSYRSYATTKSMVSQMSEQSRSVANDLLRLEAQLSMVGKKRSSNGGSGSVAGGASVASSSRNAGADLHKLRDDCGMTVTSRDYTARSGASSSLHLPRGAGSHGRRHISASARQAAARTLRSRAEVVAPPGKLGIILANRTDSRGTVVSGVRTSSVLADRVSPGDRIVEIDGEDVSRMNVREITTIMARKAEFERVLVIMSAMTAHC